MQRGCRLSKDLDFTAPQQIPLRHVWLTCSFPAYKLPRIVESSSLVNLGLLGGMPLALSESTNRYQEFDKK